MTATATPVISGEDVRRAELRVHLRQAARQQAVARHRERHPGLAEHQDHHHDDQPDAGADGDQAAHPVHADGVERGRQRRRVVRVDVGVVLHAGDDQADAAM